MRENLLGSAPFWETSCHQKGKHEKARASRKGPGAYCVDLAGWYLGLGDLKVPSPPERAVPASAPPAAGTGGGSADAKIQGSTRFVAQASRLSALV